MSGRLDSNQRPPEPHSGALAKLRHAPSVNRDPLAGYGLHAVYILHVFTGKQGRKAHFPRFRLPKPAKAGKAGFRDSLLCAGA